MLKTHFLSKKKKVILTEAKFLIRGFLYQATLLSNIKLEARKQICFILVPFLLQTKNPQYFWQLLLSFPYAEDRYGKAMCGYKIYKTVGLEKTTQVLRDSTLQVSNIILCQ